MRTRTALDLALSLCVLGAATGASRAQCALERLSDASVAPEQEFGREVAADGRFAFVGSFDGSVEEGQGSVSIFELVPSGYYLTQKLGPGNPEASGFGKAIDVEGARAVVGAPGNNFGPGFAYVVEHGAAGWVVVAELAPSDPVKDWDFGESVTLSGDTVIVGSPVENGGASSSGAAYVYERHGETWVETHKLFSSSAFPNQNFGTDVALVGDVLLVGAEWDHGPAQDTGAVHVWERSGSTWSATSELWAADTLPFDRFGGAVDFDGVRALVGASGKAFSTGRAYVFTLEGTTWSQETELFLQNPEFGALFGRTCALRGDLALVGAPGPSFAGAAYLFEHGAGGWAARATLVPPATGFFDDFGEGVALVEGRAVVGAPGVNGPVEEGVAWAFSTSESFATLIGTPGSLSLSSGGTQVLALNACLTLAADVYWVLGSLSGTAGVPFGDLVLPLTSDRYFAHTAAAPSSGPLSGALALLDHSAKGVAQFSLPSGSSPALAGVTVHHAFLVLDHVSGEGVFASNAVGLVLVP